MSKPVSHTPGPWRTGKNGRCVVADTPVPGINGSDAVEHYGGHLICESVASQNLAIIAAAPRMLAALQKALPALAWASERNPVLNVTYNEVLAAIKMVRARP